MSEAREWGCAVEGERERTGTQRENLSFKVARSGPEREREAGRVGER